MGERPKRKGTYVYLWPIHVDVWQKPEQYCKAIIPQLKINKLKSLSSYYLSLESVLRAWAMAMSYDLCVPKIADTH